MLTLGMNPSFLTIVVLIGLLYVLQKLTAGMGTFVGQRWIVWVLWGFGGRVYGYRAVSFVT